MGKKFTPESIVVRTALDEHGSLLDVSRIAGEDLISYSERLFDAYANRSSSTYTGLLNGINRELDIDREDTIEIRIKSLGLGDTTSPFIILSSTTLIVSALREISVSKALKRLLRVLILSRVKSYKAAKLSLSC